MSPVENKEHKPGPIGKERSLKNRKVKDAQQVEPEGQEKPIPAAVRSADPVTTKDTKAASEMSGDIGAMISVPAAEYGTDVKVSCAQWVHIRPKTAPVLACSSVCFCWWHGILWTTWVISTEQILFHGVHM